MYKNSAFIRFYFGLFIYISIKEVMLDQQFLKMLIIRNVK